MKININKVVNKDKLIAIPTNRELQEAKAIKRSRISDLPAVPKKLNTISLILTYTTFGLDDEEIAEVLGMTEEQVLRVKQLDEYDTIRKDLIERIKEQDVDEVRGLINKYARTAVVRVGGLINTTDPQVALAASKDILDRSGQRPVDIIEHRHKMEGGLTIEYVKKDTTKEIPTIDITSVTTEIEE